MAEYQTLTNLGPIEIQQYQQNRFPCFFIDLIEEAVPGKVRADIKTLLITNGFFRPTLKMNLMFPVLFKLKQWLRSF